MPSVFRSLFQHCSSFICKSLFDRTKIVHQIPEKTLRNLSKQVISDCKIRYSSTLLLVAISSQVHVSNFSFYLLIDRSWYNKSKHSLKLNGSFLSGGIGIIYLGFNGSFHLLLQIEMSLILSTSFCLLSIHLAVLICLCINRGILMLDGTWWQVFNMVRDARVDIVIYLMSSLTRRMIIWRVFSLLKQ